MSNLPPSGFGTPGAPMDTLATANPTQQFPVDQVPRAESFNLVGQSALGAQARIVALESLVNTQRALLNRASQTALYIESATTNAQDGVNGPTGLAPLLAQGGIDLRYKIQWSAGIGWPLALGEGPGSVGSTATVFTVRTPGTTGDLWMRLYSAALVNGYAECTHVTPAQLGNPVAGTWVTLRQTVNLSNGQCTNYTSNDDGATWTQVSTGTMVFTTGGTVANFVLNTMTDAIFATWGAWSGGIAWAELRTLDGTIRASVDFRKPWHATTWTDPQSNVWSFRRGGGAWFNQGIPGQIRQRIEFTASGSCVIPAWATTAELYVQGGGAGGGGGGSASTIANQYGGSGGGASLATIDITPVTGGATLTATVGGSGLGGAGGASGGAAGGLSGVGGNSYLTISGIVGGTWYSFGGARASGSAANTPAYGLPGMPNGANINPVASPAPPHGILGWGAFGGYSYWYLTAAGGAIGGLANATNGGAAGPAVTARTYFGGGATGAAPDANGLAAAPSTMPGCGGSGGGGGAPGGAGGAGGSGGPGRISVLFRGVQ